MATGTALDTTSLSPGERRTVGRFVDQLQAELGDELVSVWLYGSRARGEPPRPESDVDLLIVTRRAAEQEWTRAFSILESVAEEEGSPVAFFSLKVVDPEWVDGRRAIDSFFIREVDRDKVVLAGTR